MRMSCARTWVAILVAMAVLTSCKLFNRTSTNRADNLKGLSASASAENVALLMTAYGSTPVHGGLFETDMEYFRRLVTDPAGNYRFKTMIGQRVGHHQMLANIKSAASQVSSDGTLLIFITAHGSQGGTIQPEDQAFATIGYNEILQAIREGRNGNPFRRLVLFISACFSGSWFNNLPSSGGLFNERLVITSVGPNEYSWISRASSGMLQAFHQLKGVPNATLLNLVGQARANVGSILYSAVPESIMSEPIVNSSGPSEASDEKPMVDRADGDKENDRAEQSDPQLGRILAVTTRSAQNVVELFVYSQTSVKKIEMQTSQGWFNVAEPCMPQPNFPSIFSTKTNPSWTTESTVRLRLTLPTGSFVETEVNIEHR